ncbi:MAG: acyl-CoA dehydrogenase [Variovorax paradoxus]|nr:MAG: acyl-CoA dehydrogenase [Variovorax paradoxus]PZQ00414.1 MAG: acyl-CoA dehydrogenase [Variovorax paradoxus]
MSDLARPLAEAAERLFTQRCGADVVGAAEAGAWPQALWSAVDELGATQLLVPEARGGAGGDWFDACALLERAGEFNLPLPLPEAMLAGWLLDRAGCPPASGPLGLALTTTPLAAAAAAGRLNLDERAVPWAAAAAGVVLVGPGDGDDAWLLFLPRSAYTATPDRAPAGDPRDRISCTKLALAQAGVHCQRLPGLRLAEVQGRAALLRAAQIAGACRRVLALTLAYTGERVQFGRAIGQFQAVQHQLAQLAEEAAAVRVAVQAAAQTADGPWALAAMAAAKVRAGEAAGLCARIAHQLHGAMGVTAEHPLHQSTRRLLSWRDDHGAEAWWSRVLVQTLRDAAAPGAWQAVVAATSR